MYKLIAIILLLAGCTPGERTIVVRSVDNGRTTFDSRATIDILSARFECRASATGACHYALFAQDCSGARCDAPPLRQFAVDAGDEQTLDGLPHDVLVCMQREASPMTAACLHSHS
jgi:hypothetical protein